MSSSESSTPDRTPHPHAVAHNLYASDPTADEMDLANHSWMVATVIEDDDLMFGGKPLCAWYEEDRRRLSSSTDEEETRGRQRERAHSDSQHHQKAHHEYQHQHERHHAKKSKDAKEE
jgi:hypothetical protein